MSTHESFGTGTITPMKVLLVEDNPFDAELALETLRSANLQIEERVVWTEPAYRAALAEFDPDVILCDFAFPEFDGESALRIATTEYPSIPLIFVSGTLSEERLVVAVQNGAVDYVLKSNGVRLPGAVIRAVERAEQRRRLVRAEIRVARLGTIRDVMSAVDRAISRYHDREALLQEVCRIATETGKYLLAAIGTRTAEGSPVAFDAFSGIPVRTVLETWLADLTPDLDESAHRLMEALRTGTPIVANDLSQDLSLGRRREMWDAGVRSLGAFPLVVAGVVAGGLVIATGEIGYFSDEEIALFTDVAGNLSFAMTFINEQHRAERVSRIRNVLSAVNETILRVTDAQSLYREVCRIAFEVAGYVSVLAVTVDELRGQPRIAAAAGAWASDSSTLERTIQEKFKHGRGLLHLVLRTSHHAVVNDMAADVTEGEFYPGVQRFGVQAIGVFPLAVDGQVGGAMIFDTLETGYFDDEEVALLTNLTSNVAFALGHIGRRARLERLSRIRDVLSAVNVAIVRLRARAELCQEACRIAVEVGGFSNAMVAELDVGSRRITVPFFLGRSDRVEIEERLTRGLFHRDGAAALVEASIRTMRPAVTNDVLDWDGLPSYERLVSDRIAAIGSFPIMIDEQPAGAMVFETEVRAFFDGEEVELLTNLTNNLGFGLNVLEKQQRVDYLSYYDAMTSLPNRLLFYDRLGQDIAASKKAGKGLALAIVDIARFSVFNNTLGENVGDEALKKIAGRLRDSVEEGRLARVGGDKFALSFPMIDDLSALAAAITEDGIKALEAPFTIRDQEIHITACAGCAVFPSDGEGPEELFQNAESALLSAKASGATYQFYAPELNVRLAKALDLEARLKRAIDEHQFVLFYQPKVQSIGRRVVGFEGLIRWRDPQRGLVFPGEFIPMLERTGMIIPVGRWALLAAASQYEKWRLAGLKPPRIAVNLSAVQLRQDRLLDDVRAAVETFEEGCGLDVEVTEGILLEDIDSAVETLNAIRTLGPHVALDDFGTGYSSLAYIHQLPLNALKIDRSFIIGMFEDETKRSIVSTIVSLGAALHLVTIAEGVETEQDARLLELLQCDQFQGYLISKPLPPEEAAHFLQG